MTDSSPIQSVRAAARQADRGASFSSVSKRPTEPVDVTELFLKVLLAVVLMLTSAVAVRMLLVAF